jgi:fructose-bisphosphate aldolase class II
MAAIRTGFTDVMIDASSLPYQENVGLTRRVVEVAHSVGVGVEGEIGRIGTSSGYGDVEARVAGLTRPEEAAQFVADTGVDILAVSIGSAHGMGQVKGKLELDFGRLEQIRAAVSVPLVLHGGSGITDDDFRRAVAGGICKVNIHTAMALAATDAMRTALADPANGYWQIGGLVQRAIKGVVAHHMTVFGSTGRA